MTSALGRYIDSSLEDHIRELEEKSAAFRSYQQEHPEGEILYIYYKNMAQLIDLELVYLRLLKESAKKLEVE